MPKKIYTSSIIALMIALLIQFAAPWAMATGGDPCASPELGDGVCCPTEAANAQCFADAGYVVEVLPCEQDGQMLFPCPLASGDTRFDYIITELYRHIPRIRDISLLITACNPEIEVLAWSTPKFFLYKEGQGDKSSKFGRGLSLDHTGTLGRFNKRSGTFSVTVKGRVTPVANDMGLIRSSDWRKWTLGKILCPGCGGAPLPQIVASTSIQTIREGSDWCTVRITAGPEGNFYERVDGTCEDGDIRFVTRGKYAGKAIEKIQLLIWLQRTESPACWYYTLPNGEDLQVCF